MHRLFLFSVLALTAGAVPASAQGPASSAPMMQGADSAFLEGMTYRLVGPSRGGRVTAVAGVPSQPRTFYMGAASGGVFRTTDGGESWQPVTDGQVPLGSTGSIAVADSDPDIVWLGTGSDGLRSNVSTGRGVYRSLDGGDTWAFRGLYDVGQIGAVRIHPANPDIVWVAAVGNAFKPNPERGVYKTTDGGATWRQVLAISDSTGAADVELQPGNPDVVYAWMYHTERKPWTIISGSHEGGFYRSTDGGEHWTEITQGLPGELIGKANIAVTAANPNRVYMLIEAKPGGGLYRSEDAGLTWSLVNTQPSLITRPFYYTTLEADPTNADVVYGGAEGFFKSTDAGKTFTRFPTPHGDNHDMWINPNDGRTMIQSNDGGANVSYDGGRTWSTQNNQPTGEFYGVWIDHGFPYKLYGAQQDNTTVMIESTATGGVEGEDWSGAGPGCETGPIIPHPTDEHIVYGSCKGQYGVMDLRTGQEKNYWIGSQSLYGNPASDLIYRFQRVSPMALSPHDSTVLYYGSQYLHRTHDMGVHWEKISPDLTAHPECCQGVSGQPITRDVTGEEFYSTLYAITVSPHEAGVIWTGSNDGPFYITRDNGGTWTNVTPKDLPEGGRVQWIEASPHRPGSAYYAVYRYLLGDFQPYIYLTNDYGKTWKRLTDGKNGIPADWPTRVVREDPVREGLLYAGTEFGLFISFDNGGHWQQFNRNLPATPITDIRVKGNDLVVATQGRAFWILDDLSPLRQLTPQIASSTVHLFAPADGYRTQASPELLGPMFEYYLPSASPAPVTITILDAAGNTVNTYTSSTSAAAAGGRLNADEDDDEGFRRRRPRPPTITTNAGMNRFVWDVRNSDGITTPPGAYQVKLSVAGTTETQPFNVLIDPRVEAGGVTVADLNDQFEHNTRMHEMVADVNALVARVQAAQKRLEGASGAAADTLKQVTAFAEELLTPPIRYSKPGLQAHITYLAGETMRVDQKVGQDAKDRADVLQQKLDDITARVNGALGPATSATGGGPPSSP